MRPGPRPVIRGEVIDTIRLAIEQGRELYVAYRSRHSGRSSGRRLHPYGFLLGKQHNLVGMSPGRHPGDARLFALGQIQLASVSDRTFVRDSAFSLQKFTERSFGVFQEEPYDIVWKLSPPVADVAVEYVFHPGQSMEKQRDGSVIVQFRAGGLMEVCWHLYTWGANVEVLAPFELQELMEKARMHQNFRHEAAPD